ncbi:metallophosphoesterase [Sorangium sp. So ce260]|uniref:metallophosphoesterase n=1 Tax=Sorangium sp. So ce260 TaxID=3133291 RepID=UPI003F61C4AD
MFQLGGLVVTLVNALLGLIVWRRLRAAFPRRKALVDGLCAAGLLLVAHPALLMTVASWSGLRALQRHLPEPVSLIALGAQVALLLYALLLGIAALGRAAFRALRRGRRSPDLRAVTDAEVDTAARGVADAQAGSVARADSTAQAAHAPAAQADSTARTAGAPEEVSLRSEPVDATRRRLLVGASWALPVAAVAVSMGGVLASRQRPVVVRVALPVRRELTSLHGVTLAQLSDVHVGSFMDAERLDELRDAMNALRADIHVITGDLLDHHVSQLELSARLLRGLRPTRGQLFFCMGNHEYIAARSASIPTIVKGLEEAGAQVLVDEAREVRLGGDRLWMSAIDYPSRARPGEPARRPTADGLARALGQMRDDGAPRVLLSHHPGTFRAARELPFDLMLSGHTHGGQISLGRIGDYALTPMLPAGLYHNGLYEHRGRRLHVNAGAGGWLPVRINCPPEITLVELVPA